MDREIVQNTRKRKLMGHKKNSKGNKKKLKNSDFIKPKKMDPKFKKMLMKKARDYNSGSDDDGGDNDDNEKADVGFERNYDKNDHGFYDEKEIKEESFDDDVEEGDKEIVSEDEDENGEIQPGVTRFTEGCKAFGVAFRKIIKKAASDDVLGPVLSAHKKLVAEKLAEEDVERKSKSEAKKEKHLISEKGHVKPANYLDTHEKFLISVATKGVVKLFNAVNKAQHAQKGLNPLRAKDEKAMKKRRKEAFFSELGKNSSQQAGITSKGMQVGTSTDPATGGRPGWAPLRDDFMLTNSKLKDWDKKQDSTNEDDSRMPSDSDISSDDD